MIVASRGLKAVRVRRDPRGTSAGTCREPRVAAAGRGSFGVLVAYLGNRFSHDLMSGVPGKRGGRPSRPGGPCKQDAIGRCSMRWQFADRRSYSYCRAFAGSFSDRSAFPVDFSSCLQDQVAIFSNFAEFQQYRSISAIFLNFRNIVKFKKFCWIFAVWRNFSSLLNFCNFDEFQQFAKFLQFWWISAVWRNFSSLLNFSKFDEF